MSVTHCDGVRMGKPCRTLFAVGLMHCPHCGSTEFHEFGSRPEDEEHPMAKITVLTGVSNADFPDDEPVEAEDPTVEPVVDEPADEQDDEAEEAPADEDLVAEAEEGDDIDPDVVADVVPSDYRDGTISEVLDWVGADSDRALVALDAEKAKGDEARSTLVDKLTRLVDEATSDDTD